MNRTLNFLLALFAAVAFAPLLLIVAVLVAINIGSPVLFRQRRPGLHGELFELIKFRTMRDATDAAGQPLPDAERMTPFGTWVRRTSLDELPELWNVLRGDMNLVGPRPLLEEYLPLYSDRQKRRHEVRPGITGWAQINGRNRLDWNEKFELDVWYVDNRSLLLDLKILARTAVAVIRAGDVNQEGHVSAENFKGNE